MSYVHEPKNHVFSDRFHKNVFSASECMAIEWLFNDYLNSNFRLLHVSM
jgi:hypothetical protein